MIAISRRDSKKEKAWRLGACYFIATGEGVELYSSKKINRLLVTTSKILDWTLYAPILHRRVHIFPLTVTDFETELHAVFA